MERVKIFTKPNEPGYVKWLKIIAIWNVALCNLVGQFI
jgi:hypothetical protein